MDPIQPIVKLEEVEAQAQPDTKEGQRGPSQQMDILEGSLESLVAQHDIEVQQLSAKQNQEKLQMFQALLATEKQEKIELQGQVADLRCALSDALGYRQNCHELEKEVRRLKNSGAEAAALCEVRDAQTSDLINFLQTRVEALEAALAAERATREKQREVLMSKLLYETGRHMYYRRMSDELRRATEDGTMQREKPEDGLQGPHTFFSVEADGRSSQEPDASHGELAAFRKDQRPAEQDLQPRQDVGTCQGNAAVLPFCKSAELLGAEAVPVQTGIEGQIDEAEDLTQPEPPTRRGQVVHAAARIMERQSPDGPPLGMVRPGVHNAPMSSSEAGLDTSTEQNLEARSPGLTATPESRRISKKAKGMHGRRQNAGPPAAQRKSGKVAQKRPAPGEEECVPRRVPRTSLTHKSPTQMMPVADGQNQEFGSIVQDNSPTGLPMSPVLTSTVLPPGSMHEKERFVQNFDTSKTDESVGKECGGPNAAVQLESARAEDTHVLQELPNVGNVESTGIIPEAVELLGTGNKIRQLTTGQRDVLKALERPMYQSRVAGDEQTNPQGHYSRLCGSILPAPHNSAGAPQKLPEHLRIDMEKVARSKADRDCDAKAGENCARLTVPGDRTAGLTSMPPPPRRDRNSGWRQRPTPFEVNDQALSLLGMSKALDYQNAAPAPVRPAIVDRKPSETTVRAENNQKEFKYMESVRKQGARRDLQGVECGHCQKFMDALESWGSFQKVPGCGHTSGGNGKVLRDEHLSRQRMCQDASRHRYKNPPPPTPREFWEMGFRDSQDSRF